MTSEEQKINEAIAVVQKALWEGKIEHYDEEWEQAFELYVYDDGPFRAKPEPKPLREEWRVYSAKGVDCGSFSTREKAEKMAMSTDEIVHMREVRDDDQDSQS